MNSAALSPIFDHVRMSSLRLSLILLFLHPGCSQSSPKPGMSLGSFGTGSKVLCALIECVREVGIPQGVGGLLLDLGDLWDLWEMLEAVTTSGSVQGTSGSGTHCSKLVSSSMLGSVLAIFPNLSDARVPQIPEGGTEGL